MSWYKQSIRRVYKKIEKYILVLIMISYQSIPFEVRLIITQTSPKVWYIMVQVDPEIIDYSQSHKIQMQDLFTRKKEHNEITKYKLPNGQIHRNGDLPAAIYKSGALLWFQYGKRHRDGGKPAVIGDNSRNLEWWENGICINKSNKDLRILYFDQLMDK
jgi:hypothetical protein